ncbi:MAG: hypothetical protein OHK0029_19610 [Armatimonadaceae bacterium]
MANILILIHGMITERDPANHHDGYGQLIDNLAFYGVRKSAFAEIVEVEWGHEPPSAPNTPAPLESLRPDEVIQRAEATLYDRFRYENVNNDRSPHNHLLSGVSALVDLRAGLLRLVSPMVKEQVLLLGMTDALYYASPDGEAAVRAAVYGQILRKLRREELRHASDVRLFVIAHSLGATVAHDFLFGLFNRHPDYVPGFLDDHLAIAEDREDFVFWRAKASGSGAEGEKTLSLGALITAGGQLPLMMMRDQRLIERLARREFLDPEEIGIPSEGFAKWRNFYDVDDLLGFPCRRLYRDVPTIEDYQVDTAAMPNSAHTRYWENEIVLLKAAELIRANLIATTQ